MEPEKTINGKKISIIVIIIILVVGGVYMWMKNKNTVENVDNSLSPEETTVTTQDSSELDSLEKDLNASDTNIGVDVNSIE